MNHHRCCACDRLSIVNVNRKNYCAVHRPPIGRPVTMDDLFAARKRLSEGQNLQRIAMILGVMKSDLDLALWQNLHVVREEEPRRYEPEFVA